MAIKSTPVTGIFNTSNFHQDITVDEFSKNLLKYSVGGQAPMFALSGLFGSETIYNTKYDFWAETMIYPRFTLTANVSASDTTFTVDSTETFLPNDTFRMEATGEVVIVNQILSATTLSVTRGVGAAAINITSDIPRGYKIGNAFEESSLRPNAKTLVPVKMSNRTQIFRNSFAVSGTAEQVRAIIGDQQVAKSRADGAEFHANDIEFSLIFGRGSEGIRNGQPFRTMDGILQTISNIDYYPDTYNQPNVFQALPTGTSYDMLETWLENTLNTSISGKYGNERTIYAGATALTTMVKIGRLQGQYQIVDGQTVFGMTFTQFRTARGVFNIVEHPLFNTNQDWMKMALVVDQGFFDLAYLGNRKQQIKLFNENGASVAQDYGIDATGGTITSELTNLVRNAPSNAVIYGLEKAIAN